MDNSGLLKSIAETGYNVGFGAKKHFATYDMTEKLPGFIAFTSFAIGILSLVIEPLSAKLPSAVLTIVGVASLYLTSFIAKKSDYESAGKRLTQMFNELRDLYRSVQHGADPNESYAKLKEIEAQYYTISISNQAFLSDTYAHYKFFGQQQHDWIEEQKKFTWRDKIPVGFFFGVPVAAAIIIGCALFSIISYQ